MTSVGTSSRPGVHHDRSNAWLRDADRIDLADPGDVVAGSLLGSALAQVTAHALERPPRPRRTPL